ncbi:MAG: hypothetical protein ACYSWQ_00565 [Planctomycetota bacterium]|jgi:hypothetical protein
MNRSTAILIAMITLGQVTTLVFAQEAGKTKVDPSGTWRREYDWNDTRIEEVLRLKLTGDGKVVGTLSRNDAVSEIKDGKFEGNELSFSVSNEYQGTEWTTSYKGIIEGDEVNGTVVLKVGEQSWDFDWIAKRDVDPSGTWRREYDWNNATVQEAIRLNLKEDGKIVGTLSANNFALEVKDIEVKGNELSFSVSGEYQGTEWSTRYKGVIKGDEIDGAGVFTVGDQSWDFDWKPKRTAELDDVVGTWQIRIVSPDGNILEPTVKISKDGDEYKSLYTSAQGQELDVKNLRVENNILKFTVTAEFDGYSVKVDYQGRPYGDKLSGLLDYDFGGTAGQVEFTARRKQTKGKE